MVSESNDPFNLDDMVTDASVAQWIHMNLERQTSP